MVNTFIGFAAGYIAAWLTVFIILGIYADRSVSMAGTPNEMISKHQKQFKLIIGLDEGDVTKWRSFQYDDHFIIVTYNTKDGYKKAVDEATVASHQ